MLSPAPFETARRAVPTRLETLGIDAVTPPFKMTNRAARSIEGAKPHADDPSAPILLRASNHENDRADARSRRDAWRGPVPNEAPMRDLRGPFHDHDTPREPRL